MCIRDRGGGYEHLLQRRIVAVACDIAHVGADIILQRDAVSCIGVDGKRGVHGLCSVFRREQADGAGFICDIP